MANTLRSTSRTRLEQCRSAHDPIDWNEVYRMIQGRLAEHDLKERANPIPQPEPETRGFVSRDLEPPRYEDDMWVELGLKIGGAIGFILFLAYLWLLR